MHTLVGLLVAVGCAALLFYLWREAQQEDRASWKLLALGLPLLAGLAYLSSEYVFSIGPDDFGARAFAQAHLVRRCTVEVIGFRRDQPNSTSGVYRIHYQVPYSFSRLEGVISCRYDSATQHFTLVQTQD